MFSYAKVYRKCNKGDLWKKIAIKKAKEIAKELGYDQVLIFGWDKTENITSVATYGKSVEDCDQIAQGGNWFKEKVLKWPKSKCCAEPNRYKKLKEKCKELEDKFKQLKEDIEDNNLDYKFENF